MTSSSENSPQKYDFHIFDCKTPPLDTPQTFLSTNRIIRLSNDVKVLFPQYLELCRLLEQYENESETVTECCSDDNVHVSEAKASPTKVGNAIRLEKHRVEEYCSEDNVHVSGPVASLTKVGNAILTEESSVTEYCPEDNVHVNEAIASPTNVGNAILTEKHSVTEYSPEDNVHSNSAIASLIKVGNALLTEERNITEYYLEDNIHVLEAIGSPTKPGDAILTEKHNVTEYCNRDNDHINGAIASLNEVGNATLTEERSVTEYCLEDNVRVNGAIASPTKVDSAILSEKQNVTEYLSEDNVALAILLLNIENVRIDGTTGSTADIVTEKNGVTEHCSEGNVCIEEIAGSSIETGNDIVIEKNSAMEHCSADNICPNETTESNIDMGNNIVKDKHDAEGSNQINETSESPSKIANDFVTEKNNVTIYCAERSYGGDVEVADDIMVENNSVTGYRGLSEENSVIKENITVNGTARSPIDIAENIAVLKSTITVYYSEEKDRVVECLTEVVNDIAIEKNNVALCTDENNGIVENPPETATQANCVTEYFSKENDRVNESTKNPTEMVVEECCSEETNVNATAESSSKTRDDVTEKETTDKNMERSNSRTPVTAVAVELPQSEDVLNGVGSGNNNVHASVQKASSPSGKVNEVIASKDKTLSNEDDEPKLSDITFPLENALKLANYVIQNLTGKHSVFLDLDESNLQFFFSDSGLKHFSPENVYVNALVDKTHLWVTSLKRHSPSKDITKDDIYDVLKRLYYSRVRVDDKKYFFESSTYKEKITSDKYEIQIKHVYTGNPSGKCMNCPAEKKKLENCAPPTSHPKGVNTLSAPLPLVQEKEAVNSSISVVVQEKSVPPLVQEKVAWPLVQENTAPVSVLQKSSSSLEPNNCLALPLKQVNEPRNSLSLPLMQGKCQLDSVVSLDKVNHCSEISTLSTAQHCLEAAMPSLNLDSSVPPTVQVQCNSDLPLSSFALENFDVLPLTQELAMPALALEKPILSSSMFTLNQRNENTIPFLTNGNSFMSVPSSIQNSHSESERENNSKRNTPPSMININFPGQQTSDVSKLVSNPSSQISLNQKQALQNQQNFSKCSEKKQGNDAISLRTPVAFAYTYNNFTASVPALRNDASTNPTEQSQLLSALKRKSDPGGASEASEPAKPIRTYTRKPAKAAVNATNTAQPKPKKPLGRPPKKLKSSAENLHTEAYERPATSGVNGPIQPPQSTYTTFPQHALVQHQGHQPRPMSARNDFNAFPQTAAGGAAPQRVRDPRLACYERFPAAPNGPPPGHSNARATPQPMLRGPGAQTKPVPARSELNTQQTSYRVDASLPTPERTASRKIMHSQEHQMPARNEFNSPYARVYHNGPAQNGANCSPRSAHGAPGNVVPNGQFYPNYGHAPPHGNNFQRRPSIPPTYEQHYRNQTAAAMYHRNTYYPHGNATPQQPDQQWGYWNASPAAGMVINPSDRGGAVHSNQGAPWSVSPPTPSSNPSQQASQQLSQQQQGHPEHHAPVGLPVGPSSALRVPPVERRNTSNRSRSRSRSSSSRRLYQYLKFYRKPSHLAKSGLKTGVSRWSPLKQFPARPRSPIVRSLRSPISRRRK